MKREGIPVTCLVLVALLKVDVDVILFDGGRRSIRVHDCHLLSTGSSTCRIAWKLKESQHSLICVIGNVAR